ncbi:MAG: DNA-directed RNA polymerase subunit beta [Anaerolineaceae bacterium 4572_5.1]|nr:MAG: DNA-directed RNA polymerase subunit beta [Anaerolineaceae bacterium 4572_5.1]
MAQMPAKSYARISYNYDLPPLIDVQTESFKRLKKEGIEELLNEVSPIESYNKKMRLYFPSDSVESKDWGLSYRFEGPEYDIQECVERDLTYSSSLYVSVLLAGPKVPEPIKQEIFMGEFPEMTPKGTFIINGTERVVVSQLIRSPGVYFEATVDNSTGRRLATAKMIPDRGAWMEFETRKTGYLVIRFNRQRTIPVTIFLRALAAVDDGIENSPFQTGTDEELMSLFEDVDTDPDRMLIAGCFGQEPEWELVDGLTIAEAALIDIFKRMRPGDPATIENAREFLESQLFNDRRYNLKRVGRYKLDQKFELYDKVPITHQTITKWDIYHLVHRLIKINNRLEDPDDIDHLGNRRIKTVDELIQNKLRVGFRRMERVIRERMSLRGRQKMSPVTLVNIRPVVASLREFFGSSQLSQFMDQTNPLAELRHKRTLSALGPGGLHRQRAGFDVRDVHQSHYGRICPIETPEGPNIGLIGRFACYAEVNDYGFIETPYRKVYNSISPDNPELIGCELRETVKNPKTGKVIAEEGVRVNKTTAKAMLNAGLEEIKVRPYVSKETIYLAADAEDRFVIAQGNAPLNEHFEFTQDRISARHRLGFDFFRPTDIEYMDVAPNQIVGISAALIPFLSHDDANRTLMGANMQAQGVPLLKPDIPIVSTGMERPAALDSGQVLSAEEDGEVVSVVGDKIIIRNSEGELREYNLWKYQRSNQSTCIDQRPIVSKGQIIHKGDVLADSSSTVNGHLALGQNVVIAFLSWEGANFEDSIVISEHLIENDYYTSIHIEEHEVESRDTRLGAEEITRDIPNVGEEALKDLDEDGIIRVGAKVGPKDILVGKISPKGEKELSPEERLLRAIFGEKSRDVRDTSLRMPHGERGKVIEVQVYTREDNADLAAGVEKMVRIFVAQRRRLTKGDKIANKHGNKGVVSTVVPAADMPFLEDGTPVDMLLSPIGVPGRMNIGQVLETHLGWAAHRLGFRAVTPVFDGATEDEIEAELARAWMIDKAWKEVMVDAWEWLNQYEYDSEDIYDEDEVRRLYLEEVFSDLDYDSYELSTNQNYARRAVLSEWLRKKGYKPDEILFFEDANIPATKRDAQDERTIKACLEIWIMDITDAKKKELKGLSLDDLRKRANEIVAETRKPLPTFGKQILRDGMTGKPYDHPVTVGVMNILKLHHLVEDKVHARSTGPYSLVTQQPLGGKAQFGGQRFGEMEVWALEAYGAAHILQEMLTIKSDDVVGRVKAYESIVKGEPIEDIGVPASFHVLVREMQSLGLSIEAITEDGEVISFGKEDSQSQAPRMATGLLKLGRR